MNPNIMQAYLGYTPSQEVIAPMQDYSAPSVEQRPSPFDWARNSKVATYAVMLTAGITLAKEGLMASPVSAQEGNCVTTTEEVPGPEPGITVIQETTKCGTDVESDEIPIEEAPATPEPTEPAAEAQERETPKKPKNREAGSSSRSNLSERQRYADEVLDLINDGVIVIQPLKGGKHAKDQKANATPRDNLKSALAGKPSHASDRCSNAPEKTYVNPKVLRFLSLSGKAIKKLGGDAKLYVTAIVGGCHTGGSDHYSGNAVDLGCPITPKKESIFKRAARKAGMKRYMGESCANDGHEHWSVSGR